MAYENLCMYCFKNLGGDSICPHCGKDARAAVPQIQMLPGTPVYRDRFLVGRALGQDAGGIVYNALDTKRGGTIRIREYLPRNCAERLNDGTVVPIAGMEDAFEQGMRKLQASIDSVEDPRKRHFYFEENGTAYIAQRKNVSSAPEPRYIDDEDEEDAADHRKQVALYIAIAAAVVLAVAIGLIWFLNSMGDADDTTITNPLSTTSPGATWMPAQTPTPTPYATATFAALVDPELSWMDYTYSGDVNDDYQQQVNASATRKPTVNTNEDYNTVNSNSSASTVKTLQERLVQLGWLDYSNLSGKYDSATRQAVKDFQNYVNTSCSPATKLAVDGIAGEKTQQWLYNASVSLSKPTPTPTPMVTPAPDDSIVNENSPAVDVRALQNKLIALGLMQPGSADGVYGSGTANAVKNFQIRVNQLQGYTALEVTGKVNEMTMAYLNYYIQWWEQQQQATAVPTQQPTSTPAPPQTADPNASIDAFSPAERIAYVQQMLADVNLMDASGVDGVYGSGTIAAVKTFQDWVNQTRGEQTLQVSGVCDSLTRTYLEYCVREGFVVTRPTSVPTSAPTQTPTEAPMLPTQAPTPEATQVPEYNPGEGEGEGDGGSATIDPASPVESITYVQEMLAEIGLLGYDQVDGQYGDITKAAVRRLQEYVNAQGGRQLNVSGICDPETLQALMYAYDRGMTIPGTATAAPTQLPTEVPTEVPTVEPTQAPQAGGIHPDSDPQTISRMQEMLAVVGLLGENQVDGDYGAITQDAVRRLQQFVNDIYGERVLEVSGLCDADTLRALQQCYEEGWNLGDHGDEPDYTEPTQAPIEPTQVPVIPTEVPVAPTEAPTPEPTQVPQVGEITSFSMSISGRENDGSLIELEPGDYNVSWNAQGNVAGYFLYLLDEGGALLKSAENTGMTSFPMNTSGMQPGHVYQLKIGALPVNGGKDDVLWQTMHLMLTVPVTPEPTPVPTPEPTPEPTPVPTAPPSVSAPSINIGSSAYQQDGVTYINDSTIIFSWMASGDVQSYTVDLIYQDGTSFSLGTTADTSKTVNRSQLQPGLYKLRVGATPIGGDATTTVWSELLFGVPQPEPVATPIPTEAPTQEPIPEVQQPVRIEHLDASSDPEQVKAVQEKLYQWNLLNPDNVQYGVLDTATLQAVAAFQQQMNETMQAGLYVIDPAVDIFVDFGTLSLLMGY